jgi:hypothetical protein
MPLEKLTLKLTDAYEAVRPCPTNINNHRPEPNAFQSRDGRMFGDLGRYFRSRISDILTGIRAPAAASTNWPSIVEFRPGFRQLPLLKFCDPNKGGTCYYRQESETGND